MDAQSNIPSQDWQEGFEIHKTTDDVVEVTSSSYYHQRSNSYSRDEISIEAIVDHHGQTVEAIWEDDWTEITPGIETRSVSTSYPPQQCVRIARWACPVRVLFSRWSEYVDYGYTHSSSHRDSYWVHYEADSSDREFPEAQVRELIETHMNDFCEAFRRGDTGDLETTTTPQGFSQAKHYLEALWQESDLKSCRFVSLQIVTWIMSEDRIKVVASETWEKEYQNAQRLQVWAKNIYEITQRGNKWLIDSGTITKATSKRVTG